MYHNSYTIYITLINTGLYNRLKTILLRNQPTNFSCEIPGQRKQTRYQYNFPIALRNLRYTIFIWPGERSQDGQLCT